MTGLIALALFTVNLVAFVMIISAARATKCRDIELSKSMRKLGAISKP